METKSAILKNLLEVNRSLQSELTRVEALIYSKEHLTSAAARVIVLLHEAGPLSVPFIGRSVGSTRQNIQMVVHRLQLTGIVEAESNPHHKRSSRIVLTERGEALYEFVISRQNKLFQSMAEPVSEEELKAAIRCLETLATQLTDSPRQKRDLRNPRRTSSPRRRASALPKPVSPEESPDVLPEEEMPLNLL